MVQIFRSHNPISILWLVVLLFLMRIGVVHHLPVTPDASFTGLFSRLLIAIPAQIFTRGSTVFYAGIIVLLQALWLNYIINKYNLFGKPSFLPALLYITVSGLFTAFYTLGEPLICNFLMIWMLQKLLYFYKAEEATSKAYDLGLIVGIGTLIYFPFIALFLVIWIGLLIFRSFNWHEWVSALMGFFTVLFFLLVYYYCTSQTQGFQVLTRSFDAQIPFIADNRPFHYLVLVPLVLIFVLSLFRLQNNFLKSMVMVRKTFQLLFFILLIVAAASFIKTDFAFNHFLLGAVPIATLSAYYFLYATKKWFYESLYLLLLFGILYIQFNNF